MNEDTALVIRSRSRTFTARYRGEEIPVHVPKKLRFQNPDLVDPVAVGDRVRITVAEGEGVIEEILPRRNGFSRPASGRRGKRQLVAANLDLAVVVMATAEPVWKPATIDRYLVLASSAGVPPAVVINKIDLDPETPRHPDLEAYRTLGIPVLTVSAETGEGTGDLLELLSERTSVLLGPSGVGKSSLLNRLVPDALARVSAISDRTGKGTHTTTWVELWDLPRGGKVVDSPGLRVLDLTGVEPEYLGDHFPEIHARAPECRFPDCRHLAEPGCAVKEGVESGEVPAQRYDSYVRIHKSLTAGRG